MKTHVVSSHTLLRSEALSYKVPLAIALIFLACGWIYCVPALGQSTIASRPVQAVEADSSVDHQTASSTQREALPSVGEVPQLSRVISLDLHGVTLEEALNQVAAKAALKIAYLQEAVSSDEKITMRSSAVTARKGLEEILQSTGRRLVSVADGHLVLVNKTSTSKNQNPAPPRDPLKLPENIEIQNLESAPHAREQEGSIAGTVTDAQTGEPIPGVNIVISGTETGAATGPNGEYSISGVEEGTYTLEASFVGYGNETRPGVDVRADETTIVDFQLQRAAADLEEVVVVGYGEQERRDLTGAVSSVDAAQLEEAGSAALDQALQGKVAGVRVVQSSGAPGAEPIVRIRGRTSILGNNQPLYVIDGLPIGRGGSGGGSTNPLATINPGDIQSIDVLKDASATAIYGARGSNGVIVITTKSGQSGERRVNFESQISAESMKRVGLMDTEQYVEMANDRAVNGGLAEPFPNGVPGGAADTDWLDTITQNGLTQSYGLSVSGGDESGNYRVSGNYLNEEGSVINSSLERASFTVNLQEQVGNLTISPRISATRVWQDVRGISQGAGGGTLIGHVFNAPPLLEARDQNGEFTSISELAAFPFAPGTLANPLAVAELGVNELTRDRILGNLAVEYQLTDGLSAEISGGGDIVRTENDDYTPVSNATGATVNSASESRSSDTRWLLQGQVNFDRAVAANHDISATAVATLEEETFESLSGNSQGFVSDALENNNLGAGNEAGTPQNSTVRSTLISYVGRANYTYLDRYLLTLTGRVDGSSVFGEQNKWGTFPSVALAWRASEEEFLQNTDQISNLKVRLSWGISGSQAIDPYQTLASYSSTNVAFNRTRQVGLFPTRLESPDLQWEETEQFNLGVDVGLYSQRYTFGLDVYRKETRNLLANVPQPPSSGFSSKLQNIGRVQNQGIEFQFDSRILTGDLSWSLGGNISANRNKVEELARGSDITSGVGLFAGQSLAREGEPIGSFFGLELGDPPLTEEGRFNFVNQDGDGDTDADDRVIVGNPYPSFTYGVNTELRYQRFSLRTLLQGVQGKEVFSFIKDLTGDSMFRGRNQVEEVFTNRWTREEPDRNAEYPAALPDLNKDASEWQVEDASYLRLKTVRVGYSIPVDGLNIPFRNASIYLSGQNLWTITPYDFFSPDSQSFNGNSLNIGIHDVGNYPFSRTFTFGLNVGF